MAEPVITGNAFFPFCEVTFENPKTFERISLSSDGLHKGGDGTPLDIDFSMSGGVGAEPQTATLKMKNLAPTTKAFFRRMMRVNVTLGYRDGERNNVLSGVITRRENPILQADDSAELSILDDSWSRLSTPVNATFLRSEATDIVKALALAMGVPLGKVFKTGVIVPKFITGDRPIIEAINDLMKDYVVPAVGPWKFHLRQGSVNWMPFDEGFITAILLSPETGLSKAEPVGSEADEDTWFNVDVVESMKLRDGSLADGTKEDTDAIDAALQIRDIAFDGILQPMLLGDSFCKLESKNFIGTYRVKEFSHSFSKARVNTSGTLTPAGNIALAGAT